MNRETLLRSKEYWVVKIQNSLFQIIEKYLEKNNLKRNRFASKIGVSKGYISQVLNGDFDHKISKLVELSLACDKVPVIHFLDLNKVLKEGEDKPLHIAINKQLYPQISYINYITSESQLPIYHTNDYSSHAFRELMSGVLPKSTQSTITNN